MKTLDGLGWQWHKNGVVLCVSVVDNGQHQKICVFVPLSRVWAAFNQEMSAVGFPLVNASVGDPYTVSGLFSGIKHAVSKAAHSVTHAVSKAAGSVAHVAQKYGQHALNLGKGIVKNKYFRSALDAAAFAVPALAPAAAAMEVANKALNTYHAGIEAAQQIKKGINTAANALAVAKGLAAHGAMQQIMQHAKQGNAQARQIVGAIQQHIQSATGAVPSAAPLLHAAPQALMALPGLSAGRTYSFHNYHVGTPNPFHQHHQHTHHQHHQHHRARVQAALHSGHNVRFA